MLQHYLLLKLRKTYRICWDLHEHQALQVMNYGSRRFINDRGLKFVVFSFPVYNKAMFLRQIRLDVITSTVELNNVNSSVVVLVYVCKVCFWAINICPSL